MDKNSFTLFVSKPILLIPLIIFMTGCNPGDKDNSSDYAVLTGEEIYNKNCLGCHGPNGQGLAEDWKVKDANGNYPPPPLNGTAHTWHHSPEQLLYTINKGGVEMGGQMPAFENLLSKKEKQALIDYIYSLWPKEIQEKYDERFK
ncbi:cytochrome c [Candidatus Pseudothioglobus singularis]|nr:cytochrome c [Candidatus Pseudothioglobus singularis]